LTPKLLDEHFELEDFFRILEDATKADELDFVRCYYHRTSKLLEHRVSSLVEGAASSASPSMVDYWLEKHGTLFPGSEGIQGTALDGAIMGENIAVIRHLVTQPYSDKQRSHCMNSALMTCNPEIVEIFLGHGWQLVENPYIFSKFLRVHKGEEDEAFRSIDRMRKYVIGTDVLSWGFYTACRRGLLSLAKYFIDLGVDIECKLSANTTTIYDVVRRFSGTNAESIKFLLQQGANPYPKNSKRQSIESLGGMRKAEKYFGKTWKELVVELQGEKASTTDEPSEPSQH
jgi:hypothetical protein